MKAFLYSRAKFIVLSGLLILSINVSAQKEKLQTAFIYQLTRLIEWCPEGKEGNFVIGVLGNEPTLMAELTALTVRRVGNQQIEIKTFAGISNIEAVNIIFVSNAHFDDIKEVSTKVGNHCTLIVSERTGGANKGAGVSIIYNEKLAKLELEINKGYMKRKALNVNDQLYSVASTVY